MSKGTCLLGSTIMCVPLASLSRYWVLWYSDRVLILLASRTKCARILVDCALSLHSSYAKFGVDKCNARNFSNIWLRDGPDAPWMITIGNVRHASRFSHLLSWVVTNYILCASIVGTIRLQYAFAGIWSWWRVSPDWRQKYFILLPCPNIYYCGVWNFTCLDCTRYHQIPVDCSMDSLRGIRACWTVRATWSSPNFPSGSNSKSHALPT